MTIPYFKDLNLGPIKESIVILDIDGTLLADNEQAIDEATTTAVKKLLAQGNMVYLCSNGFSHKHERNHAIAKQLGVTFYETEHKKPLKMAVLPLVTGATKPVVVIGDKFLTDGMLAVNLGVPFIAVRSLRSGKEELYSRLAYIFDDLAKRLFAGWARPPHYADTLYRAAAPQILTIVTRPPLTVRRLVDLLEETAKRFAKKILFSITRKPRYLSVGGPQAVIESLLAGLADLNIPHRYNPWQHQVTPTVSVVRGVDTLRWALEQKQKGFIKTIIAGPNIVVAPPDEQNLIKSPLIDKVIVPSEWNKKWWMTFDQLFETRATVWAAGVTDHGGTRNPKGVCIVYSKNADERLFNKIMETLWTHKLPIVVSNYGQFRQAEYFRLLKHARMLVYLSEYESQGIALNEAWMADIPTLVWNRGYFMYQDKRFEDATVGAPYLTADAGLPFEGDADFELKLIEFLEKYDTFKPREYSLAHFTNAICARKYLNIIEDAQK